MKKNRYYNRNLLVILIMLGGVFLIHFHRFLLFHHVAEMFSIVVCFGIFMLAWNSRDFCANRYILFLGIFYAYVALIEYLHAISYRGMELITSDNGNIATQLWICARFLESISLFAAPVFLQRKLSVNRMFFLYTLFTAICFATIFIKPVFPACFSNEEGLTSFKRVSEFVICAFLFGAVYTHTINRQHLDQQVFRLMIGSIVFSIVSELAFTLYSSVDDAINALGHLLTVGSFYLVYRAVIESGLRKPYHTLFRDLAASEQKVHREKKQMDQLVEQLGEKNEELESILHVASHDLRSPLVNIQGYSEILAEGMQSMRELMESSGLESRIQKRWEEIFQEDVIQPVQSIQASVRKMDSVLEGLLRVARLGKVSLDLRPLDMNVLLRELMDSYQYILHQKKISLECGILPCCIGDRSHLIQVFSNLLDNAIKYLSPDRPARITIRGHQESGESIYCVEDNGIGSADYNLDLIFSVFYQVDPSIPGEGLGLSTVKRILQRHNGRIWVESEIKKGSRFYVSLPSCQKKNTEEKDTN